MRKVLNRKKFLGEHMKRYQALAIIQDLKALEWCLQNDKEINKEQWKSRIENHIGESLN